MLLPEALSETLSRAASRSNAKVAAASAAPSAAPSAAAAAPPSPWTSPPFRVQAGKGPVNYTTPRAEAQAGSAVHAALLALLDAAATARQVGEGDVEMAASEVVVQVVALGGEGAPPAARARDGAGASGGTGTGGREVIIGSAVLSLLELLDRAKDLDASSPLPLWVSPAGGCSPPHLPVP